MGATDTDGVLPPHRTQAWYLQLFLPQQPDLNWTDPEGIQAIHGVLRRRGTSAARYSSTGSAAPSRSQVTGRYSRATMPSCLNFG